MIKTEIFWHKASEELPEKSGEYLTYKAHDCGIGYVAILTYSKAANRFNQSDGEAPPHYPIKVTHWAELSHIQELIHG